MNNSTIPYSTQQLLKRLSKDERGIHYPQAGTCCTEMPNNYVTTTPYSQCTITRIHSFLGGDFNSVGRWQTIYITVLGVALSGSPCRCWRTLLLFSSSISFPEIDSHVPSRGSHTLRDHILRLQLSGFEPRIMDPFVRSGSNLQINNSHELLIVGEDTPPTWL